jgi:sphingolipid delta-4 desaturase
MAVKTSVIAEPSTGNDSSKSTGKMDLSAHSEECQRKDVPKRFHYTSRSQIHAQRRREILDKYPEILALYGYDPLNAVWCGLTVLVQLFMCYQVRDVESIWILLALTYIVSGTLNHSLLLAMHEATHDLFFKQRWLNQLMATIANLPMGVPAAAMFRIYHSEHHSDMGVDGVDTDVPTELEAKLF